MLNKRIEKIATNLLEEYNITKLPILIEKIAEKRGLKIKYSDLGDGVSGVLLIEKGNGVIGVNPCDPPVRQRFTIAHEFGHYVLHRENQGLFIDKKGYPALFRNQKSSTGEYQIEQEANSFAAAILMPEDILIKEIRKHKYDLSDDDAVKSLADSFNVSTPAMTYRIANLNLFSKI